MVKHTQTFLRQQPTNSLSVFDHFVGLELKGLTYKKKEKPQKENLVAMQTLSFIISHYKVRPSTGACPM